MDGEGEFSDLGRYSETKLEADEGAFKTPTLRNVAISGPYMHDGSLKTLKDVVDFYAGGGNSNPDLDKEIKAIQLSGQDRTDLVTFLESLTGEMPKNAGPPRGKVNIRYETYSLSQSLLLCRDPFRLLGKNQNRTASSQKRTGAVYFKVDPATAGTVRGRYV